MTAEHTTPTDVAVAFIEAFGSGDMTTVGSYLAADILFESPRVKLEGAEAVLEALSQFAQAVLDVKVIAALGDGEQAMIMYEMRTGPFGALRAVDHLVVRDGKIQSDLLVFDTHKIRQAHSPSTP